MSKEVHDSSEAKLQSQGRLIMRLVMSFVLSAMLGLFFSQSAGAQTADSPCQDQELVKAGTVEGEIRVAGFLVGVRWGDGTLTLNDGRVFEFRMRGMKLLEFGLSSQQYTGTVYNLDEVEDFTGTYVFLASGVALVRGLGAKTFGNGKCVVLNAKARSNGVHLAAPIGPGGVTIEWD